VLPVAVGLQGWGELGGLRAVGQQQVGWSSHQLEGPSRPPGGILPGCPGSPVGLSGLLSQSLRGHCPPLCPLREGLLLTSWGGRVGRETRPHDALRWAAAVGGGIRGPVTGSPTQYASLAEAMSSVGECGVRPRTLTDGLGHRRLWARVTGMVSTL